MKVQTSEIVSIDEDGENPVVAFYETEVDDVLVEQGSNRRLVREKLEAAFGDLQQIIDTPGPFNAAQITAAVKTLARVQRGVLRANFERFDGAD
jgi:predicted GNAT family acetyltransferase